MRGGLATEKTFGGKLQRMLDSSTSGEKHDSIAEAIHNGTTADNVKTLSTGEGTAAQPGNHTTVATRSGTAPTAGVNAPIATVPRNGDTPARFTSAGTVLTRPTLQFRVAASLRLNPPLLRTRDQSLPRAYQLSEWSRSDPHSRSSGGGPSHLRSLHSHQRPFARRSRPELQRWQSLRCPDVGRHRSPVHRRDARHAAAGPASHRGHGIRTDSVNRPNRRCSPLRNRPRCNAGRDTTTRRSPARRHTDRSCDPRRIGSTGHSDARRRPTHRPGWPATGLRCRPSSGRRNHSGRPGANAIGHPQLRTGQSG